MHETNSIHIDILGGGIAGLSVGYFSRKQKLSFAIYEAAPKVGGNAQTIRLDEFLFDSGAHRLHDKDITSTMVVQDLLGTSLKQINVPSQIYYQGKWIDFPLSPWNLLKSLGPYTFAKAVKEVTCTKFGRNLPGNSFESFALNTYGKTIAERFLLNYSEKLWGRPCKDLSSQISGKRLEGLNLKTFLIETLMGELSKTRHLDGSFLYPDLGIGMIADKMAEFCGLENVHTNARITRIRHDGKKIAQIETNKNSLRDVSHVVSTIPLDHFIRMLEPAPPAEILQTADTLTYRHVILTAFTIHKRNLGRNASIYFPEETFPFVRLYEPKQRSPFMAHEGKTSLVAEIACSERDPLWTLPDEQLRSLVEPHLLKLGWFTKNQVGKMISHRMPYAYPVQDLDVETRVQKLQDYCGRFGNLQISGRNGRFSYIHIHHLIRIARDIVAGYFIQSPLTPPMK